MSTEQVRRPWTASQVYPQTCQSPADREEARSRDRIPGAEQTPVSATGHSHQRAGDGIRTHDNNVGNVVLCQLSYTRRTPPVRIALAPTDRITDYILAVHACKGNSPIPAIPPLASCHLSGACGKLLELGKSGSNRRWQTKTITDQATLGMHIAEFVAAYRGMMSRNDVQRRARFFGPVASKILLPRGEKELRFSGQASLNEMVSRALVRFSDARLSSSSFSPRGRSSVGRMRGKRKHEWKSH